MNYTVPIESLINHIKSAVDVDQWAQTMAEEFLKKEIPVEPETEGGGSTWWTVCGECHGAIDPADRYCKHCGQKVTHT